jgi:hypothetical protein
MLVVVAEMSRFSIGRAVWVLDCDGHVNPVRRECCGIQLLRTTSSAGVAPADAAGLLGHDVATHMAFYVQSTETGTAEAARTLGNVLRAAQ